MNQNTNNMNFLKHTSFRLILICLLIITVLPIFNAQILASTTVDKQNFYENEVGMLKIKVFNDYNFELEKINLRIEGTESIRFVDDFEEKRIILKEVESLRSRGSREIFVKLKVKSIEETQPKIFVYYGVGDELQNASVTFVNAKKSNISIKTNARKINTPQGEKIVVDFTATNYSGNEIKGLVAEIITPENYIIETPPFVRDTLEDGNSVSTRFDAIPPPEASGKQRIVLSYAYVDESGPHYFEEVFELDIERMNYLVLAVIGVTILVIAGYLYILRDKKDIEKVKGSADKE